MRCGAVGRSGGRRRARGRRRRGDRSRASRHAHAAESAIAERGRPRRSVARGDLGTHARRRCLAPAATRPVLAPYDDELLVGGYGDIALRDFGLLLGASPCRVSQAPATPSGARSSSSSSLRMSLTRTSKRVRARWTAAYRFGKMPFAMRRSLASVVVAGALLAGIAGPHADARPAADAPPGPPRSLASRPAASWCRRRSAAPHERQRSDRAAQRRRLPDHALRQDGQMTISMTVLPIRRQRRQDRAAPRGDGTTHVDHLPDVRRPGPRHALPRRLSTAPCPSCWPASWRPPPGAPNAIPTSASPAPTPRARQPSRRATTRRTPQVLARGPRTTTRGAGTPSHSARTAPP